MLQRLLEKRSGRQADAKEADCIPPKVVLWVKKAAMKASEDL